MLFILINTNFKLIVFFLLHYKSPYIKLAFEMLKGVKPFY